MPKLSVHGKAHETPPAQGPFTWFLYGSSLDREAFAAWTREHGYAVPDFTAAVPAILPGHRLVFDVQSRFWGGATASFVAAPGHAVEGLALPLPAEARGLVDHKEGGASGLYEPAEVEVRPLAGGPVLPAIAYRAAEDRRLPAEAEPSRRFLETVIRGARAAGLSEAWLAQLEGRLPR